MWAIVEKTKQKDTVSKNEFFEFVKLKLDIMKLIFKILI